MNTIIHRKVVFGPKNSGMKIREVGSTAVLILNRFVMQRQVAGFSLDLPCPKERALSTPCIAGGGGSMPGAETCRGR
jgi:hypothetical protein